MRYLMGVVLFGCSILMNCFAEQPSAQKPNPDLKEECRQAFAWMTKLGYPETKDLKFVLVATGHWLQQGNNAPENRFQYGFLMEDRDKVFKIVTLDLDIQTFEKTPPETEAFRKVGYEILDLDKEARALLVAMKADGNQEKLQRHVGVFFGPGFWPQTQVFLLSWVCSRRGLDDTAAMLYEYARDPKTNAHGADQEKSIKTLQEKVAEDLANVEMWRGVLQFGDPEVPRSELLKRFELMAKNFPKSSHYARARVTADLLKKMIKEDEEHAESRKKGKPFDQLSKQEQVAELVFQLREQNGHQFSQPGFCDIFGRDIIDPSGGKGDTAAHKLVKLGYEAVPQLIEHLDDERFTRSVGYHRDFYFSHYVLRVNDCALAILEEIAGQSFWKPASTFSYMSMDNKAGETKKRVEEWYAEFKKKSEKRFLIEATERGDHNSGEMAQRLVKKYRRDALPSLIKGAKAATDGIVRATLVELIAEFKGEDSLQFLLAEVKDGPLAEPRLTAAKELHILGRPEGLAAMLSWWRTTNRAKKPRDEEPASLGFYIAEFLASCGEVKAIELLAKDLDKRPVFLRLVVIDAVSGKGDHTSFFLEMKPAKEPSKMAAAVEALLVSALDDREESIDSVELADSRVCDRAACVLGQLYSQKYTFDPDAPLASRNRQLVVLKNVWRAANKLSALPVPELRKVSAVSPDQVRPLLDHYSRAKGMERTRVRNEIEKLGLGTLPFILERRDKANDENEKTLWNGLASRVSCIVCDIEFVENSIKPDMKVVEGLKGKPFDPTMFIQTVGSILHNRPKNVQSIRVRATRVGDAAGMTLLFDLITAERAGLPNPANPQEPPTQYTSIESVTIGKDVIHSQTQINGSAPIHFIEGKYPQLEKALTAACMADPCQRIEISIQLALERGKR